ncbi:MAG: hypothetical protein AAF291_00400 [Pseudomonadota bacterium]
MKRGTIFLFCAGALGLCVALGFLYFGAIGPESDGQTPPLLLRAFFVLIGLPFVCVSVLAMRHAVLQAIARSRTKPKSVLLRARKEEDSEGTSYTVSIEADAGQWIAPAYGGAAVEQLLSVGASEGKAWFDDSSGKPIALEFRGRAITTYPHIRRSGLG